MDRNYFVVYLSKTEVKNTHTLFLLLFYKFPFLENSLPKTSRFLDVYHIFKVEIICSKNSIFVRKQVLLQFQRTFFRKLKQPKGANKYHVTLEWSLRARQTLGNYWRASFELFWRMRWYFSIYRNNWKRRPVRWLGNNILRKTYMISYGVFIPMSLRVIHGTVF